MTRRATELLAEALALPVEERGEVAERLLESLELPGSNADQATDDELLSELERRSEELRRDSAAGVPWDEVKKLS